MKAVQTFYSFSDNDILLDNAGFLTPAFSWMSLALSCLLLKTHFSSVTLYCNEPVRKIAIDILKIPYDECKIIPASAISENPALWAYPKIYTYKDQKEPFIHVDNDWFMFDALDSEKLSSPLLVQNIEYDDKGIYKDAIDKFRRCKGVFDTTIDNYINSNDTFSAINAGIIAFNDMEFLKIYLAHIDIFFEINKNALKDYDQGSINFIYEQLFFYVIAKNLNIDIKPITQGDKLSTSFNWMSIDYTIFKKSGYIHLMGGFKRRPISYYLISNLLEQKDPDLYNRIIELYQVNSIKTNIKYYDKYKDSSNSNPDNLSNIKLDLDINNDYHGICEIGESTADFNKISLNKNDLLNKVISNPDYFKYWGTQRIKHLSNIDLTIDNYVDFKIKKNSYIKSFLLTGKQVGRYLNSKKNEKTHKLYTYEKLIVLHAIDTWSFTVNDIILYNIDRIIFEQIHLDYINCDDLYKLVCKIAANYGDSFNKNSFCLSIKKGASCNMYDIEYIKKE